jgi:hypothetical protein
MYRQAVIGGFDPEDFLNSTPLFTKNAEHVINLHSNLYFNILWVILDRGDKNPENTGCITLSGLAESAVTAYLRYCSAIRSTRSFAPISL